MNNAAARTENNPKSAAELAIIARLVMRAECEYAGFLGHQFVLDGSQAQVVDWESVSYRDYDVVGGVVTAVYENTADGVTYRIRTKG